MQLVLAVQAADPPGEGEEGVVRVGAQMGGQRVDDDGGQATGCGSGHHRCHRMVDQRREDDDQRSRGEPVDPGHRGEVTVGCRRDPGQHVQDPAALSRTRSGWEPGGAVGTEDPQRHSIPGPEIVLGDRGGRADGEIEAGRPSVDALPGAEVAEGVDDQDHVGVRVGVRRPDLECPRAL